MEPFDTIEKLITEHGSSAILREHIAFLKVKMSHLESENASMKDELLVLKQELQVFKSKSKQFEIQKPADTCPFCRRATGELIDLKPHPELGELYGIQIGQYKCTNCGRKYEKQVKHGV